MNLSSLAWLPVDHILRNSLMSACRRLSVQCWLCSRSTVHIKHSIKKDFPHQPGISSIILEDIKLVLLFFLMFPQWLCNIFPKTLFKIQHFILSYEVDILCEDFLIHVADFEWSWLGLLIIPLVAGICAGVLLPWLESNINFNIGKLDDNTCSV